MKNLFEHIEYVKTKPHHIRKRVAFGAATFGSAFIALVWFVGSYVSNSFAIAGSNFAMGTEQDNAIVKVNAAGDAIPSGIAGTAAALPSASAPAHIEIIDTTPQQSTTSQAEQTILPF